MNLLKNSKIYEVIAITSGNTDLQSQVLDSAGYDGVLWAVVSGENGNSTGGYSKLYHQHADSSASTSMVSCTGASYIAAPGTTATGFLDDTVIVLDVNKPQKRYVSCYVTKDSTNSVDVIALGILYKTHKGPITQPTSTYGVAFSALAVSPST